MQVPAMCGIAAILRADASVVEINSFICELRLKSTPHWSQSRKLIASC